MGRATELEASEDLRRYIESTGENGLVDAKAAMKWDLVEVKASIARDIVAFANSEGGGALVIGKRELDDGTFEIDPLTEEQAASFDTTPVSDWINERFQPSISFTCHRVLYQGQRVVVIVVQEFANTPAICVKSYHHSELKKNLLEQGEVIVRTNGGKSTKLQTLEQFSTLISRAVLKRQHELREIIDRTISGRTAESKPTDEARFAAQLESVQDSLKDEPPILTELGGWTFNVHGEEFERKWQTAPELISAVDRSKSPRWREFPERYIRPQPTEWGVASNRGHYSKWGTTYEGLFYWSADYDENQNSYRSPWTPMDGSVSPEVLQGRWIESTWCIYQICSFIDFSARYAAEFSPSEPLRISIEASGLKGRQLLCTNYRVSLAEPGEYPPSMAKTFRFNRTIAAGKVESDWKEFSADAAHAFLQLFPVGMQINRSTVEGYVEKYANGTARG